MKWSWLLGYRRGIVGSFFRSFLCLADRIIYLNSRTKLPVENQSKFFVHETPLQLQPQHAISMMQYRFCAVHIEQYKLPRIRHTHSRGSTLFRIIANVTSVFMEFMFSACSACAVHFFLVSLKPSRPFRGSFIFIKCFHFAHKVASVRD